MNDLYSSSVSKPVRYLVYCLVALLIQTTTLSAFAAPPEDQSKIGRDAYKYANEELVKEKPTVSQTNGQLNIGLSDGTNTTSVLKTPMKYTDLAPKKKTGDTTAADDTEDIEDLWNDGDEMDAEGGKKRNQLFKDSQTTNPSLSGQVYQTMLQTYNIAKPDMSKDPMFNTTREVVNNIDEISKNFADCKSVTTFKDVTNRKRISDYKSCTKIYDKSETCTISHDFNAGLLKPISGDIQMERIDSDTIKIFIGKDDNNNLKGNCEIFEIVAKWNVVNPEAITRVVFSDIKFDDYVQVFIDGNQIYNGPNSNFPPETAGKCDLETSHKRNPNIDVTSYFKSKSSGDPVEFRARVSVGGKGELVANFLMDYDPKKIINNETWTPDTCIEHLQSAKAGFANIQYSCTQALGGYTTSGEYKGDDPKGEEVTNPDDVDHFCENGTVVYDCPADATNPWSFSSSDNTCSRSEDTIKPAKVDNKKGCADDTYKFNSITGVCEKKENLEVLPYDITPIFECPKDGNTWTYNAADNTCSASITDIKDPKLIPVKGCADPAYEYHEDTDTCNLPGIDATTWVETKVYECPIDASKPWSLKGDKCQRTILVTKPAYENSSWGCSNPGFVYSPSSNTCKKTEYVFEEYSEPPIYSCPVDATDPWILTGDKCVRTVRYEKSAYVNTDVSPPTYSCDTGWTLLPSNSCERYIKNTISADREQENLCPPNYEDTGTRCRLGTTSTEAPIVNTSYSCQNGFALDQTVSPPTCSGKQFESVNAKEVTEYECGTGEVANQDVGACVPDSVINSDYVAVSEYKCPVDATNPYSLINGKCTRTYDATVPANKSENWVCPTPYNWNPTLLRCEKNEDEYLPYDEDVKTVCPVDATNPWSLDSENEICYRNVYDTIPATFVEIKGCEAGWTYNSSTDICSKDRQEILPYNDPFHFECPVDAINPWTLDGEYCRRTVKLTQPSIATPEYKCDTGYTLNSTTLVCTKTTVETQPFEVQTTYACDSGWTLDGQVCRRSYVDSAPASGSPVYGCDAGFVYNAALNNCTKTTTDNLPYNTNTTYSCPSGWTLSGTNCVRNNILTQPASTVYSCPTGWTLSGTTCSRNRTENQSANVNYTCPTGWTLSGTTCSYLSVNPAPFNYSCPSGWEFDPLDGSRCRKAILEYKDPYLERRNCYTYYPGLGYYGTLTGLYTNYSTQPPVTYCRYWVIPPGPAPYNEDHLPYSVTSNKSPCPSGLTCYETQYKVWAAEICDAGFVFLGDPSKSIYQPNKCVKTTYQYQAADVNYYCNAPGVLSGTNCQVSNSQTAGINYSCPSGWNLSGSNCSRVVTDTATATGNPTCPDASWTLNVNTCQKNELQTQPATPHVNNSCPVGYTDTGTNCQKITVQTVAAKVLSTNYSCPSDRTLNNSTTPPKCDKTINESKPANATHTNYCLSGWVNTGSGCQRTTVDNKPATFVKNNYSCTALYSLDNATTPPGCFFLDNQVISATKITHAKCDAGWTDSGSQCVRVITDTKPSIIKNSYWSCPGVYAIDLSTNPPTCNNLLQVEKIPASYDTTSRCATGWVDTGINCKRTSIVTAERIMDGYLYTCDTGFTLDSSAVPEPVCKGPKTETVDPILETLTSCPTGWINTGTGCQSGPKPIVPSVQTGTTNTCQTGYLLDESVTPATCSTVRETVRDALDKSTKSCPTGFVDTGLQCEKFNLLTAPSVIVGTGYVCESGWTIDESGLEPVCKKPETKIIPATKSCDETTPQNSAPSQNNIFNSLTGDHPLMQQISASKPEKSIAHYVSVPTPTPPIGTDGVDNCVTDPSIGMEICESNFGSSPIPADMNVSPFCQKLEVTVSYDYYKGEFCYTDVYGVEQCVQSGTSSADTCAQYETDSSCSFVKQQCVDGSIGSDGRCYLNELIYDCGEFISVDDVEQETDNECVGAIRCMGSDCFDPTKEQSESFGKTAALLNAAQFMGQDLSCVPDPSTGEMNCQVFAGQDYYCKVAVGGAQDCCDVPTNIGPGDYLTALMSVAKAHKSLMAVSQPGAAVGGYQQMATATANTFSAVSKPFASYIENVSGAVDSFVQPINTFIDEMKQQIKDYISDLLDKMIKSMAENFSTDAAASEAASKALEDEGGQQLQETAGDKMLGQISGAASTLMAVYAYYAMAMMVIQAVYKCEDFEFELASKKETLSCTRLGSYCADSLCLEKRTSYCCYNSPLAKIINEQANIQLGKTISVKNPSCPGISISELEKLDWTKIDLSEWTALLTKYNLNQEVNAADFTMDKLTGSESMYAEMFPDAERNDATERVTERTKDLDLDEVKQDAKDAASPDLDGCVNCK